MYGCVSDAISFPSLRRGWLSVCSCSRVQLKKMLRSRRVLCPHPETLCIRLGWHFLESGAPHRVTLHLGSLNGLIKVGYSFLRSRGYTQTSVTCMIHTQHDPESFACMREFGGCACPLPLSLAVAAARRPAQRSGACRLSLLRSATCGRPRAARGGSRRDTVPAF